MMFIDTFAAWKDALIVFMCTKGFNPRYSRTPIQMPVLQNEKWNGRSTLDEESPCFLQLRIINRKAKVFTALHRDLFTDLFRLSISRYGEVRKSAQSVLGHGFHLYAYSYRSLLDKVLDCLKESEDIPHYQFKVGSWTYNYLIGSQSIDHSQTINSLVVGVQIILRQLTHW